MAGTESERPHTVDQLELDAPPRGDEGLEDWFERRLQARGIRPRRRRRVPVARIFAAVALAAALLAVAWAFSSGGGTTAATKTPRAHHQTHASKDKGGASAPSSGPVSWRNVRVDVLNGFGGAGAAADTAAQLRAAGWRVGGTGDAGTETAHTTVVYARGSRPEARAVARKLGLGTPVPLHAAPGVPAGATHGVAILLGPEGVPSA